jgi:argininosuccinate lyase
VSVRDEKNEAKTGKMWGGRFAVSLDPAIHRFTTSLPFDQRLARYDLLGSLAHARMLFERGVLARDAAAPILDGLAGMLRDVESGSLAVSGDDEDVHSWIERVLGERIGEPARRLHTARSRNDQTAVALRLYVRDAILRCHRAASSLAQVWLEQAAEHTETLLPGYTHLQRAQPVTLAHHLLAHFWSLRADNERLEAAYARAGTSPLGAGALAGTPHPIDPARTAALLGLPRVFPNSMWAVADRDYVVETAFACALLLVHLSRFAEEVVLWTSAEVGFAKLADRVAKGSSLMPQKKNPEPAELLRGKSARTIGDLTALLTLLKGLPLTYNSDLQEDKEAIFDALDTCEASLRAAAVLAGGLELDVAKMRAALHGGFLTATDLADGLVVRGVPFRTAHEQAGAAVQMAERRGLELWELPLDELRVACPRADEDLLGALSPEASLRSRRSPGGAAPAQVREQLELARAALDKGLRFSAEQRPSPIRLAFEQGRLLDEEIV